MSAAASNRSALRVSRSGSPGPAPTSQTWPGWKSSGCIGQLVCGCDQVGDGGAARTAVGARAEGLADGGHVGQLLLDDGAQDGAHANVEADADDRPAIG